MNKKLIVSGRSMINTVNVSTELGYLEMKEDTLIDINDMDKYPSNQIVILTTGSQGGAYVSLDKNGFFRTQKDRAGTRRFSSYLCFPPNTW